MSNDARAYTVDIEDRGDFVHATVNGQRVTPEIALAYWHEIIAECEATGCSKILLDHNFVEMISMQEMARIIGPVGDLLKGRLLAFYDRYGNYEIPEAGKMILRSKGIKMQIFHDLAEAEKWLKAN